MIPEGWKTYRIGDFININPRISLLKDGEYSFIEMKDLNASRRYVTPSCKKNLKGGSKFCNGDTLFARITPCLENGKICQAMNLANNAGFGSTEFIVLRGKESISDSEFVYYLSRTEYIRNAAVRNMTGTSGRQRVEASAFADIEIIAPSGLTEQSLIASILSSLDDKIELNLQMNKTLEAIAQTIFKEWFVDFKFPEFNEELVDGLPKGWRKSTIGNIAKNIQYGYTESSSREEIGPKFLRITDIQNGSVVWNQVPYCLIPDKEFEKYKIKDHDIFIARTGASTGENVYITDSPSAVFASYLIRVQFEKPEYAFFIGKFLRSVMYFNYIASSLGGSAQPNANAKTLTNIEIVVPENTILKKYFDLIFPLHKKIVLNQKENQVLTQLRDILMTKLMTGKIRVA